MKIPGRKPREQPSGVALITTLILLSLFTAMTLSMVIATTSDTLIDGYYRNFRGAFYAADSGVNVARQYMINQLVAAVPTNFNIASGAPIPSTVVTSVPTAVTAAFGSYHSILGASGSSTASWPGSFEIVGTPTLTLAGCTSSYTGSGATPPTCTALGSSGYTVTAYVYTYNYSLTATGQSLHNEQNQVFDNGSFTVSVGVGSPYGANTSFAAWGMFVDQSPICNGTSLVSGTLAGPVFTNGAWNLGTSGPYIFTDAVGSVSGQFGYQFGNCYQSPAQSYSSGSQTIDPTFKGSVTLGANSVPLPVNDVNQQEAVLDGLGNGSTAVNNTTMNADLKNVNGTAWPSTSSPASGIYLPYTTSTSASCPAAPCSTGGGIYVQGNANVTLSATSGTGGHVQQVFTIAQGSTTTTVTLDLTAQTTTIASGATSKTINGIPENLNNIPATEGALLYVNGTITSLSGPSSGAAIQDGSAITVAAATDIDVTGNITYKTEPVTLTGTDALVTGGNNGQVLGLFTAGGNVNLQVPSSNQNLEIDASVATISKGGSGGLINNGNTINTLTIVGGRIQNTVQNINTTTRNVWFDRRFSQGGFAPPWFPSTTVTNNGLVSSKVTATVTRLTWVNTTAM